MRGMDTVPLFSVGRREKEGPDLEASSPLSCGARHRGAQIKDTLTGSGVGLKIEIKLNIWQGLGLGLGWSEWCLAEG